MSAWNVLLTLLLPVNCASKSVKTLEIGGSFINKIVKRPLTIKEGPIHRRLHVCEIYTNGKTGLLVKIYFAPDAL